MQIVNKIDHLIKELNNLKSELAEDTSANKQKFDSLLKSAVETSYQGAELSYKTTPSREFNSTSNIPRWVDPDYSFDPQNPRKPNMRELMEALAGKSLEDMYSDPNSNWQKINSQASEMLYGVLGSSEDFRDWSSIMASDDIMESARKETGSMHEPTVQIVSHFDKNNLLTEQTAVIKNNKGHVLRALSSNTSNAEETLLNFGATKNSIPEHLEEQINSNIFDKNLLSILKNYDTNNPSVEQIVLQTSLDAISNRLSDEISLDEISKL